MTTTSVDGLELPGTACFAETPGRPLALLVHGGGGVDRHEDGFFDRLSRFLADQQIESIRFDHRAFLATLDSSISLTISGMANDIRSYAEHAAGRTKSVHLVAASFSGGAAALAASSGGTSFSSLTLLNPLLDYNARLLEEKLFWRNGRLTEEGAAELRRTGYLCHGSAIRMTAAMVNEAALFDPQATLGRVSSPTLIVHGTQDSRIPFAASRKLSEILVSGKILPIEKADHGFAVTGDDEFRDPRTVAWQEQVFRATSDWISRHSKSAEVHKE